MGKSKVIRSPSQPEDPSQPRALSELTNKSPRRGARSPGTEPPPVAATLGQAPSNGHSRIDVAQTVKELVRLAQEQGYLTYNDINEALPEGPVSPDELEPIYVKRRGR